MVRSAAGPSGRDREERNDTGHEATVLVEAQGRAIAAAPMAEGWFEDRPPWDIAVLHTSESLPTTVATAPLGGYEGARAAGRTVSVLGLGDVAHGVWAYSVLRAPSGPRAGYVQLDAASTLGPRITEGFSGSGVVDTTTAHVIGVVSDSYADPRGTFGDVAWMIPVDTIPAVWSGQLRPAAPTTPPAQRDTAWVDGATRTHRLVVALCEVPTIAMLGPREVFHSYLAGRIRRWVPYEGPAELYAARLVARCRDHGELRSALAVLDLLEDNSEPMRRCWEAAAPVLRGGPS
ncbi:hypothetical protein GCM10022402_23760 [Salinactinospora qingdaonensis]|uniref:Trypsin-like peptidase domain-containing protein n=1 Tax=Salinactinospora qingdaonensis TaxID=702744 RepID=A0ABP7FQD4_9ACTN